MIRRDLFTFIFFLFSLSRCSADRVCFLLKTFRCGKSTADKTNWCFCTVRRSTRICLNVFYFHTPYDRPRDRCCVFASEFLCVANERRRTVLCVVVFFSVALLWNLLYAFFIYLVLAACYALPAFDCVHIYALSSAQSLSRFALTLCCCCWCFVQCGVQYNKTDDYEWFFFIFGVSLFVCAFSIQPMNRFGAGSFRLQHWNERYMVSITITTPQYALPIKRFVDQLLAFASHSIW